MTSTTEISHIASNYSTNLEGHVRTFGPGAEVLIIRKAANDMVGCMAATVLPCAIKAAAVLVATGVKRIVFIIRDTIMSTCCLTNYTSNEAGTKSRGGRKVRRVGNRSKALVDFGSLTF